MENSVRDEKSGGHVNGIVQMPEKDDDAEIDRRRKKEVAGLLLMPKHKRQEKREPRVAGEKEVAAKEEPA